MSCWIEFHAARIKRLQKFSDFRKDLQLSANDALGFLGSFWCEVIELAESGEISGWTPEYLCERVGSSLSPERVWTALVKHRWIDEREDGKRLVHDWLDCAGTFLRGKYAGTNRQRLVDIWALHGRIYGQKADSDKPPIKNQLESNRKPTTPKGLGKGKGSPSLHLVGGIGGKGPEWFADAEFSKAWDGWEDMRAGQKPKLTDYARRLNFSELETLSGGDIAKAIAIINKSVASGWKGFFPLKDGGANGNQNAGTGQRGTFATSGSSGGGAASRRAEKAGGEYPEDLRL